ncbi:MAG: hypothetical protein AABX02_00980 [archaeon]
MPIYQMSEGDQYQLLFESIAHLLAGRRILNDMELLESLGRIALAKPTTDNERKLIQTLRRTRMLKKFGGLLTTELERQKNYRRRNGGKPPLSSEKSYTRGRAYRTHPLRGQRPNSRRRLPN